MPTTPTRDCTVPGCGNRSSRGRSRGRCAAHRRPAAATRGYDQRWRDTAARYLTAQPHCHGYPPGHPCPAPATQVDHIDGLGPHGPRGHDWGNLRPYCASCHSRRTAHAQPGGWNDRG